MFHKKKRDKKTYSSGSFHGVVEARVDNVLLGGTGNLLLEGLTGHHWDAAAGLAEATLERLLHGFCFENNKNN